MDREKIFESATDVNGNRMEVHERLAYPDLLETIVFNVDLSEGRCTKLTRAEVTQLRNVLDEFLGDVEPAAETKPAPLMEELRESAPCVAYIGADGRATLVDRGTFDLDNAEDARENAIMLALLRHAYGMATGQDLT